MFKYQRLRNNEGYYSVISVYGGGGSVGASEYSVFVFNNTRFMGYLLFMYLMINKRKVRDRTLRRRASHYHMSSCVRN